MVLPNLFIVGAPKCGTSSLFNWLTDHPEACGSKPKELFYFLDQDSTLLNPKSNVHNHGLSRYESFFCHCKPNHKIIFEGSTHYIYHKTALDALANLSTKPKIIFVLRKPSSRIYSSFQYSKNNLAALAQGIDFSKYIKIISGQSSEGLEAYCEPRNVGILKQEILYSRYVDYLLQWRHCYGADRLGIFLFEDLVSQPNQTMQRICQFLDLDSSFYRNYSFTSNNETIHIRNTALHRQILKLARSLPLITVKEQLKQLYGRLHRSSPSFKQTEGDRQTLLDLDEYFREPNAKLAFEFDLDLSAWQ